MQEKKVITLMDGTVVTMRPFCSMDTFNAAREKLLEGEVEGETTLAKAKRQNLFEAFLTASLIESWINAEGVRADTVTVEMLTGNVSTKDYGKLAKAAVALASFEEDAEKKD